MQNNDFEIEQSFLLINKLTDQGKIRLALKHCSALFKIYPENPRVIHGMGLLLYRCEDKQEGEKLIRRAIELKPDYADAYFNLGNMYRHEFKLDEAEQLLNKTLEIDSNHYKALSSLALLLTKRKRYKEALECCEKAISINRKFPVAYIAKGSIMVECGMGDAGFKLYRNALKLKKNNDGHSGLIFLMNLLPGISQKEILDETVAWAQRYADPLTVRSRIHFNVPRQTRTIRIGYVSGDLKLHPVSHHLKPVLASHDKSRFSVFLYNNFSHTDEMTETLAGYCNGGYRDISSMDDEKTEKMIRGDGIDILVDLAGHTAYHRLSLFARKPAPIQVSWIGYFNTTGMKAMDYLVSDPVTIPLDEDDLFVEKIVRMPVCRFCYAAPEYAPAVLESPFKRTGKVTFGSFNKLAKTNDEVLELWARVMDAVPDSSMIIKWPSIDDVSVKEKLITHFALYGISSDRLILRSDAPHPEMLAEYGDVDIALDTFPFNGGATTCEALWMGVPVVTLEGNTPISRQSKAFLHAIGHPEWVGTNPDEYVKIAVEMAADLEKLASIRKTLRQQFAESPLCDGKAFASNLEDAYTSIWSDWCHKQSTCQSIAPADLRIFDAEELYNAAVLGMEDGDNSLAGVLFKAVIRRQPRNFQARNNLGICLFNLGKYVEALKTFKSATRIEKNDGKAFNNLGRLLLELGQKNKALSMCRVAVRNEPENTDYLLNLGLAWRENGKITLARKTFERVVELDVKNHPALINLANLYLRSGMTVQSIQMLDNAISNDPHNLEALSTRAFYIQNHSGCSQQSVYQAALAYNTALENTTKAISGKIKSGIEVEPDLLRIGFVSADFRSHPVGFLLHSFFENHDPSRLSIYCYNNSKKVDTVTERLKVHAKVWHDCSAMSDDMLLSLIQADKIDILIDLSGHTSGHRLPVFYRRAAPVQASWIGYGHTTGIRNMDFIIADADYIIKNDEKWFTERVVRLQHNRFCYMPPRPSPEVLWPPVEDNGYVTFGCFNNLSKLNSSVIETWSKILHRVPHSKLILKSGFFDDAAVRNYFRAEFRRVGISSRRLELRRASSHYFMLAEYADIDIALDPFPFSGGMTSLESLWMGVPIITLAGEMPISRQTASFLKLLSLEELIASSIENYVELSASLANDLDRIKGIRGNLRELMARSQLCNAAGYSRNVEDVFYDMWHLKRVEQL